MKSHRISLCVAASIPQGDLAVSDLLASNTEFSYRQTYWDRSPPAGNVQCVSPSPKKASGPRVASADIITTENFDRNELQTFLALWWTGHILGGAKNHRACLERQPAA